MTHKVLAGHTSEETAYLIADYPYGRKLRCRRKVWIEESKTKGFRFCARTDDPKKSYEHWNAPKYSTYCKIAMGLYLDEETGHVEHKSLSEYSSAQDMLAFVSFFHTGMDLSFLLPWLLVKKQLEARTACGEANISIAGKPCMPNETDVSLAMDSVRDLTKAIELIKGTKDV